VKAIFNNTVEEALEYFVCYPNPFNPELEQATFQFSCGEGSDFTLRVFDVSGELVSLSKITVQAGSGNYMNIPWDGKGLNNAYLPNGIYYAMITGASKQSKVFKTLIYRK
jgi:flagellar hook assembly protein FlgD